MFLASLLLTTIFARALVANRLDGLIGKASAIDAKTLRICDAANPLLQSAQGIRSEMVTVYGSHDPGSDSFRPIGSKLQDVVDAAVAQVQPLAMKLVKDSCLIQVGEAWRLTFTGQKTHFTRPFQVQVSLGRSKRMSDELLMIDTP